MLFAAVSDQGKKRSANEDAWAIVGVTPRGPWMAMVADGMGGHKGGSRASQMAKDTVEQWPVPERLADAEALTDQIIAKANADIYALAMADDDYLGMGTTMTLVVSDGVRWHVAHVGDSAAFWVHDGVATKVTHDHSLVEEMIEAGALSRKMAALHPLRHMITRAVGTDETVTADHFDITLQPGDRLILCSDGLTDMIPAEELEQRFCRKESVQALAEALVARANDRGGKDNITVIVIEREEGDLHG